MKAPILLWPAVLAFMWAAGLKLPTQAADGRAVCFCGAAIGVKNMDAHVYAAHMEQGDMRFVGPRPLYADLEAAAHELGRATVNGSSAAGHSMIATSCALCGERVKPITCQPAAK